MKMFMLTVVVALGLASAVSAEPQTAAGSNQDAWRDFAQHLPVGSTVRLRLAGGEALTAVLIAAEESGIVIKPATRVPERARRISYDTVQSMKRKTGAVNFGKYAAVGGGVGASIFLSILALALL